MKTALRVFAVLILAIGSSSAMAEGSKFYGTFDVGQATAKEGCTGLTAGFSCTKTSTAYRIGGGYQFTPTLGVEASYGNYGGPKFSGTQGTTTINSDAKMSGLAVYATGTLPVSENFSLVGKLGIASTKLTGSATQTAPGSYSITNYDVTSTEVAYGIGAQYALTNTVSLRAQYDDLGKVKGSSTSTSKITLITAGIVVKF